MTPNLIFVGGTSTGKTYLATGWAWLRSIRKQVRLYNAVGSLEEEKTQGRAGALALQLTQLDGVILDELAIYLSRFGELCYST